MMHLLRRSLIPWVVGYAAITAVNGLLTFGLGFALTARHGDAAYDLAYERTVVAHMLVGVMAWTASAWFTWQRAGRTRPTASDVAAIAVSWTIMALLTDAVVFVWLLGGTPAGVPARTYFVDNQPWTTFYYTAVAIAPIIAALLHRRRRGATATAAG